MSYRVRVRSCTVEDATSGRTVVVVPVQIIDGAGAVVDVIEATVTVETPHTAPAAFRTEFLSKARAQAEAILQGYVQRERVRSSIEGLLMQIAQGVSNSG